MNDPHVEALHYAIRHSDTVDYGKAKSLHHTEPDFSIDIEAEKAEVVMKTHCATEEEARAFVEPFLQAWELAAALDVDKGEFGFRFERATVVDRDPPAGTVIHVPLLRIALNLPAPKVVTGKNAYPEPPTDLARDYAADVMFNMYRDYREGRLFLSSAGYFCVTVLEHEVGNRAKAAKKYAVSASVIGKLAKLSTEKGGPEARKAQGARVPYATRERRWIEAAMKAIIRRAAQVAHDPKRAWPQITMADLPAL